MDDWTEKRKAAHAKQLLDDPMLVSFFAQMQAQIFSEWVSARDSGHRDKLWDRQQAVLELEAYLRNFVAAGELLTHSEQTWHKTT